MRIGIRKAIRQRPYDGQVEATPRAARIQEERIGVDYKLERVARGGGAYSDRFVLSSIGNFGIIIQVLFFHSAESRVKLLSD